LACMLQIVAWFALPVYAIVFLSYSIEFDSFVCLSVLVTVLSFYTYELRLDGIRVVHSNRSCHKTEHSNQDR